MTRYRPLALFAAAGLLAATVACGGNPPPEAPPPPPPPPPAPAQQAPPPPPPPPPAPAPVPPAPPSEEEVFARMSLQELNSSRPLEDVYFDYDKSDLSDAARASLQKNSTWLKRWTSTRILIEGHADARGTSEYNLALGERRAASVRDYLASLGIDASRVGVVSKGEEDPMCSEDGEACWSRNRRGHFILTAK